MIRNGPKQTIFVSGRFRRLQMVSNLDTGPCARRTLAPKGGGL